jgi:hypothetical protein
VADWYVVTAVRPRPLFFLVLVVAWLGGLALLLKLQWDAAYFDPRMVYIGPAGLFMVLVALRAKLVVSDGRLTRARQVVSLERLERVEIRRAKFWKNEGWLRTVVAISDRDGSAISFKPLLWRRGAADVIAIVQVCARAQNLELDARTRDALSGASQRRSGSIPLWAYRTSPASPGDTPEVLSPRPTFWTRRNADGSDKKFQPQRLIFMAGAMAVVLPVTFVGGRAGTNVVRSMRCSSDRHLWSTAPEIATTPRSDADIVERLRQTPRSWANPPFLTNLIPSSIASAGNTEAVQRDAQALAGGWVLTWGDRYVADEVQVEDFGTHSAAMQFQRDYAEDHCHKGDTAFAVPSVPGAVGFRCPCTGDIVDDKISFVRGSLRIQAIAWGVRSGEDHQRAFASAVDALAAFD